MNRAQLRTLVRSWLDDPQGTYFTDDQVNVWLNNAQREVQKQLLQAGENWYVTKVYTNLVANVDTYVLPSGFLKLNKFQIVTSGVTPTEARVTLGFCTLVQLDEVSTTTGQPTVYNIRKDCVTVRPVPDIGYKAYLDYSYLVGDMTSDAATPDVPDQYQEYIAVLAALDGFIKDGRSMAQLENKRQGYLELMQQDKQQRHVDMPRQIVVTEDMAMGFVL
jgi:hypothetical protein